MPAVPAVPISWQVFGSLPGPPDASSIWLSCCHLTPLWEHIRQPSALGNHPRTVSQPPQKVRKSQEKVVNERGLTEACIPVGPSGAIGRPPASTSSKVYTLEELALLGLQISLVNLHHCRP